MSVGTLRSRAVGCPPLDGRLEPWMVELLSNPVRCVELADNHGSPVNVLEPELLVRNASELVAAGTARNVDVKLFFARKANKALSFVAAAAAAGHGIDTSSLAELQQVLDSGVSASRCIVSAAVKPRALLELAVRSGATISVDTIGELDSIAELAKSLGMLARVAPRVAPGADTGLLPTRFGELVPRWLGVLGAGPRDGLDVVGVHLHLNGYSVADRVTGLAECLTFVDALRGCGHRPGFIDLGGGVPVNYLTDQAQWDTFWSAVGSQGSSEAVTWGSRVPGAVYPFRQHADRTQWAGELLDARLPGGEQVSDALRGRGLALHLEPGRALVDGCGLTLARVAFVKERSDGVGLVGLEMNRTQCRSTSADFLVDPILIPRQATPGPEWSGFLVGAYCIEEDLILQRRIAFPEGVAPGDIVAFVNTAGYLMHILESTGHQIPLARNLVRTADRFVLDDIDRGN